MSDLDLIEIDYTRIHNGVCSIEELKELKEKYKNYKVESEIDRQLKRKEAQNGN